MKAISKCRYYIICFALFASLTTNILLIHTNRIYESGVIRAMDILGLYEDPSFKLSQKENLGFILEYLEDLSWGYPEE